LDFLISDDARRILWRFADHDNSQGKNLAQALVTFERAWASSGPGETLEADEPSAWVAAGTRAAARLLSAVEPVILYQRERFRGGSGAGAGTPRYDLGLQMKEDAVHRLLDVWTGGESCAALSFQAARLLDRRGPESVANVLCPACKVWSIHHASGLMREALSLLGGIGVTEDCPGRLVHKWIDSQREAMCEGAQGGAQRRLAVAMSDELFLRHLREWMRELQAIVATHSGIGAGALAVAMEVWLWTFERMPREALALVDLLCGILASRAQILDVIELLRANPSEAALLSDLCHIQAVNVTGEVARVCAGLVYGYGDDSAGVGFAEMQILLDGALAGSLAVKDRALEALIRVKTL
jgi:hypothetical protein